MSRVAFDRDAVLLSPPGAVRMLRRAGFSVRSCRFYFVFPKCMAWLRPFERFVRHVPLGAQYQALAQRLD